jgi:hypothetical protein
VDGRHPAIVEAEAAPSRRGDPPDLVVPAVSFVTVG